MGGCGNLFPPVSSLPSALVQFIDTALGYTSWKRSPNIEYITSEQDMIDLGWLQAADAEYPSGSYLAPVSKRIEVEGNVIINLPLRIPEDSDLAGVTGTVQDAILWNGGTGKGPVSKEDAAVIFEGFGANSLDNIGILSFTTAIAGILFTSQNFFFKGEFVLGSQKAFAMYQESPDSTMNVLSNGIVILILESIPSTFNDMTSASKISLNFSGWENSDSGFTATTGILINCAGLDIIDPLMGGISALNINNMTAKMTGNVADNFLSVTNDNTIIQGSIKNSVLTDGSLGKLITGIDETSLNTFFSGNTGFNNTAPNLELNLVNNVIATLDPGDQTTWVKLTGVTTIKSGATWFDDNSANMEMRYLQNNTARYRLNTAGSIERGSGGNATLVTIGAFLNAEADPFAISPVTITNVPTAIPGLLSKVELTENDVITFKAQWTGGDGFNILVDSFTGVID